MIPFTSVKVGERLFGEEKVNWEWTGGIKCTNTPCMEEPGRASNARSRVTKFNGIFSHHFTDGSPGRHVRLVQIQVHRPDIGFV